MIYVKVKLITIQSNNNLIWYIKCELETKFAYSDWLAHICLTSNHSLLRPSPNWPQFCQSHRLQDQSAPACNFSSRFRDINREGVSEIESISKSSVCDVEWIGWYGLVESCWYLVVKFYESIWINALLLAPGSPLSAVSTGWFHHHWDSSDQGIRDHWSVVDCGIIIASICALCDVDIDRSHTVGLCLTLSGYSSDIAMESHRRRRHLSS